jgi:hypothetical protein
MLSVTSAKIDTGHINNARFAQLLWQLNGRVISPDMEVSRGQGLHPFQFQQGRGVILER